MSVASRIQGLLRRVWPAPPIDVSQVPFWTPSSRWDDQVAALGITIDDWLRQRRGRAQLYADPSDEALARLGARWPDRVARTRAAADRICAHEFDLLGSGPVVIADPDRRRKAGYKPIDWSVDPIAGLRFPSKFPHKAWNPAMRPGLADIKWPWEIGRCQHWVALGQAYRFTGDERYAAEIVHQHADFLEANPVGTGMQFVCTMDVAIRAFNWVIAFDLIRRSAAFDAAAMAAASRSLFDVGQFIEENLENNYEVTSNHFLSNIVGLYAVAVVFRDLPAGQRWIARSREWLEQEMQVQVLEDGVDYESSVPYHRLVAELFMGAARIAALHGTPMSDFYLGRLRQMIEFHVAVTRPDGLMPQVGDADDGRLHIFTDYGTWRPQDGRHLAGPAAAMFGEPSWLDVGGDDGLWEAAWWGFNPDTLERAPAPAAVGRLFPHAGLAVSRHAGTYLLVTNGRVGTSGFGNHKHNDLLGFEFHAAGVPLIVDPGSYLYTSDPDARNLFRSTRSHNTLQIDGVEQNELRLDYLFRMFETSAVEHVSFDDTAMATTYKGRHTGYERLTSPVTHEREFQMVKDAGALVVTDRLTGAGRHALAWHFHLAPGVEATGLGEGRLSLRNSAGQWEFRAPSMLNASVVDAWYSPSFGVRVKCRAIDFTLDADVAQTPTYRFAIGPAHA